MKIWKIKKIPTIKDSDKTSIEKIHRCLRDVLYNIQHFNNSSSIELLFVNNKVYVDIYLVLNSVITLGIGNIIENTLINANYQYERCSEEYYSELFKALYQTTCRECYAITKKEKIVTTSFLQEGYYYWADNFTVKNSELDNYNLLFQTLLNNPSSFISFQLMPTNYEQEEIMTLQNLDMLLRTRMQPPMLSSNNYMNSGFEPYAQVPYNTYNYYVNNRNQPMFLYNIIVGSNGGGSALANQLMATIKAETENTPEIHFFPIDVTELRTTKEQFPFAVSNVLIHKYRDTYIWGGGIIPPNNLYRMPLLVTAEEALAFFHLPIEDGRIDGVEGTSFAYSNEIISEKVKDSNNIIFGQANNVYKDNIGASASSLSKHMSIVGMPGTGKTTFALSLLLQLYKKGVPFLAIEPTKAEYRALLDAIPEMQVFTPGSNLVSPFIINPFVPPKGITVEKYIPSLMSAFKAAFSMPNPLDVIFLKAIRESYTEYGWREYSTRDDPKVTLFGLHEFIVVFRKIISDSNYSKDVKNDLESGGVVRLSNLIDQNKYIFDTVNTIPIEDIISKPTVIELNAIDDPEQKALIIALLLININIYTKNQRYDFEELRNAILIDEAHVLLESNAAITDEKADPRACSVQLIQNMIAEMRAYGTSIIVADQRPSAIGNAIIANTDIKVAFRLTEKNERAIIANSMDGDLIESQLPQLEVGQAFIYYNKLQHPQLVATQDVRKISGIRKTISDSEVVGNCRYWQLHKQLLMPHKECKYCLCGGTCSGKLRADAEYLAALVWRRLDKEISSQDGLLNKANGIPYLVERSISEYEPEFKDALIICTRIALIRKAGIEKGIILNSSQKHALLSSPIVRKD